jgi:hypothetical protein
VTGIIDCAVLPFMFVALLAVSRHSSDAAYYALSLPALASLAGIPIVVGALKMKRLQSRRFALASSILAMIPRFSPAFLLGVPMGIWSLIVLTDPDVEAAFARGSRNQGERPLQTSSPDGADHAPSERPGRGFLFSVAEHPVLWTVAIVLTLPLIGTLLVIASVVSSEAVVSRDATSNGSTALSLPAGILVMGALVFTPLAILAWAYLWRASHRARSLHRVGQDAAGGAVVTATDTKSNPVQSAGTGASLLARKTAAVESPQQTSAMMTAFADWWSERESWLATSVKAVLLIVYVVCFFLFFGFHAESSGDTLQIQLGEPSPWFVAHNTKAVGFGFDLRFAAWSWLAAIIGFFAYYAYCRIRVVETGKINAWMQPNAHVAYWGGLAVVAILLSQWVVVGQMFFSARRNPPNIPPARTATVTSVTPPREWTLGPHGPKLNPATVDWIHPNQFEAVNKALRDSYLEYLALEKQNIDQSTDKQGHVVTVVHPLTTQLSPLESHFWSRLDAILDRDQQNVARLNLPLYPRDRTGEVRSVGSAPAPVREMVRQGIVGWGKNGARFEIWREGTWYRWKIHSVWDYDDTAPELPDEYRRFWKEPTEEKTSAPASNCTP